MDSPASSAAEYLRPKDVKARFRISEATIYRWIGAKKVEAIHKDGITLIVVASLDRYLATWRRRSTWKEGVMEESDVMVWLADNHAQASVLIRDLPDHHRRNLADMLIALARDSVPNEREWQSLLSCYIRFA